MKILMSIFVLGFAFSCFADQLPPCEQARASQQLKNETHVKILAELGNIRVQIHVLNEHEDEIIRQVVDGKLDRATGQSQLDSDKAELRQLSARSQELADLGRCIGN